VDDAALGDRGTLRGDADLVDRDRAGLDRTDLDDRAAGAARRGTNRVANAVDDVKDRVDGNRRRARGRTPRTVRAAADRR
jgi:hypothetical protein